MTTFNPKICFDMDFEIRYESLALKIFPSERYMSLFVIYALRNSLSMREIRGNNITISNYTHKHHLI